MATLNDNSGAIGYYTTSNIDGTYTYDAEGNRTYEKLQGTTYYYDAYYGYAGSTTSTLQESTGTYDAMGRLLTFNDPGSSGNGTVAVTNDYDAQGNVRHTTATHYTFNNNQTLSSTTTTDDYWYKYDSHNRMTTVKGSLVNGQIVRGTGVGRDIAYDLAGERVSQTQTVLVPGYYQEYVGYIPDSYYESRETYTYTSDGLLANVYITQGSTTTDPSTVPSAPAPSSSNLRAQNSYDAIGRVTDYKEFAADGTTVNYNRYAITYDARNQVLSESSTLQRYENGYLYVNYSTTTNTYASGGGPVSQVSTSNYAMKNGNTYESRPSTQTNYTYGWWDTAQQSSITYKPDINQGTTFTTSLYYDNNGHLTSAYIADGRPRNVAYVVDATGQILVRTESDNTSNGDPKQAWWFFDGKQLGTTGNDGNSDPDYTTALAERTATPPTTPGAFRLGSSYGTQYSDFDQAYNSLSPGEGGGPGATYIARGGDTLASVAQAVYGDSSLWYLIADANGLTGNTQLAAGQQIRIPSKLANVHNTSDTFRPYDAARSIGDLTPSTPKPPAHKKKGCGILGAIFAIVLAVVVAVFQPQLLKFVMKATMALTGIGGTAGAVLGVATFGALSSAVTQGVSIAVGLQDKFSWKGVALGAISAGLGFGLDKLGAFSKLGIAGGSNLAAAARGVLTNAATQGIGVATGLQDKFSWSAVAAAGVGNFVGNAVGGPGMVKALEKGGASPGFSTAFANAASAVTSMLANAGTRSILDGTDFGDNVVSALPDVVTQIVGNTLRTARGTPGGSGPRAVDANGNEVTNRPSRIVDDNGDELIVGAQVQLEDYSGLDASIQQILDDFPTATPADRANWLTLAANDAGPRLPGQSRTASDAPHGLSGGVVGAMFDVLQSVQDQLQAIWESYQGPEIVVTADRAKVNQARQERYQDILRDLKESGVWPLNIPKPARQSSAPTGNDLTRAMRMTWGAPAADPLWSLSQSPLLNRPSNPWNTGVSISAAPPPTLFDEYRTAVLARQADARASRQAAYDSWSNFELTPSGVGKSALGVLQWLGGASGQAFSALTGGSDFIEMKYRGHDNVTPGDRQTTDIFGFAMAMPVEELNAPRLLAEVSTTERLAGAAESVGGIRTAEGVVYNGITGPGPLGADVASTFRSGSYLETVTSGDTLLYRVYGGKAGPLSKYWTRTPPSGPLQATIDSALLSEWGNTAQNIANIRVPAGTTIYEGAAAGQGGLVGGGSQVVIPKVNPSWLVPGH